jgi:hypothetical protein
LNADIPTIKKNNLTVDMGAFWLVGCDGELLKTRGVHKGKRAMLSSKGKKEIGAPFGNAYIFNNTEVKETIPSEGMRCQGNSSPRESSIAYREKKN